jgi:hypothetical protein
MEKVMPKQTCLDNEFITIWYYTDKKIVHHEYHKFMQGEPRRESLMAGTALLRKHNATKWLSDDRKFPVQSPEDSQWGEAIWFPQTVEAGWKHWAIVMPQNPIGQISIKQLVKKSAAGGVNTQIFTDVDEAMKWLESQ